VRAGCVLPTAPGLRRAADLARADLELCAFLDADGRAAGRLYQDAGDGGPQGEQDWRVLSLRARPEGDGTWIDVLRSQGSLDGPPASSVSARVHVPGGGPPGRAQAVRPAFDARDEGRRWFGDWSGWGG